MYTNTFPALNSLLKHEYNLIILHCGFWCYLENGMACAMLLVEYDYEHNFIPCIPLPLVVGHRAQPSQSCQALYHVADKNATFDCG